MSSKPKPQWNIIILISLTYSILIPIFIKRYFNSQIIKYFIIAFLISILEFAIFIQVMGMQETSGFSGIGESVFNLFIMNPGIVALVTYLI